MAYNSYSTSKIKHLLISSLCAMLAASAATSVVTTSAASAESTDKTNSNTATTNELAAMYEQDQNDRKDVENYTKPGYWKSISAHDKAHHDRVIELMKSDKLQSGDDYYYAAMIMQHGDTAKDYVLAHLFAEAAAQRGNKPAVWLTAASFDRLMQSVGQPQIFATQYYSDKGKPFQMKEPLDADLITDSMRKAFDCPAMAENQDRLKILNAKKNQ